MRMSRTILFVLLILVYVQAASSQQSETGVPPFGSFHGTDFELVSLFNGNLHMEIPLVSVPQRAGPDYSAKYIYDMPTWEIDLSHPTPTTSSWDVAPVPQEKVYWNLMYYPVAPVSTAHTDVQKTCNWVDGNGDPHTDYYYVHTKYIMTDSHGTKHAFEIRQVAPPPGGLHCGESPNVKTGSSLDGTGITIDISSNFNVPTYAMPDDYGPKNGNILDTLGRQLLSGTSQNGSQIWTINDSNGTSQQFRIDYTSVTGQTSFCAVKWPGGNPDCHDLGPYTKTLPQKLTLPTGKFYQFTWSTDGNADLLRVDLPSGGYVSYQYQGFIWTPPFQHGISQYKARRRVISRTLSDGQTARTWTYDFSTVAGTVTITDPLGNSEAHVFSPVLLSGSDVRYETQVRYYQGPSSGTPIRTINKDYTAEQSTPIADDTNHGTINVRLIRETTILEDGSTQKKTETDYETCVDSATNNTLTRLNPIEKREYDYGVGAPGGLLRRTDYTYVHTGNPNYLSRNIVRRVLSKTTYDGNNKQVAQTVNEYDNYSHPNQPMLASGAVQHDSTYTTSFIYRGNKTAVRHWVNTSNTFVTTTNQYDDAGSLLSTIDPLGNKTSFDYTDAWSNTTCAPAGQGKAYLTKITNALNQITTKTYNSCTGSLASTTDPNLRVLSTTYDMMGRTTQINYADGGSTTYCHSDLGGATCTQAGPPYKVIATKAITTTPALNQQTTTVYDGLGRITQTQLSDPDQGGADYIDTAYDALGRKSTESNPHGVTSLPTDGITTYVYDALSRVCAVGRPDGAAVSQTSGCPTSRPVGDVLTVYSGKCTTVTDEAGKSRKTCDDALGRMATVLEDPNGLAYETDYSYDTLDNLTGVAQQGGATSGSWRNRSFTYNSLSQLKCAANPEVTSSANSPASCPATDTGAYTTGTIGYSYDADGNLITRTAPAQNQTTTSATTITSYSYDPLNRLIKKTYSGGPSTAAVQYAYDGNTLTGCTTTPPTLSPVDANPISYQTAMCDGSGATSWSHDQLGRALTEQRIINGTSAFNKATKYTYYLDGELKTLVYPGVTRTITYTPNSSGGLSAGRILSAMDSANGINYVTNATYTPAGALNSVTNGGAIFGAFSYNSRLQPLQIFYGTNAPPVLTGSSCPATVGNILHRVYSFGLGANDNGNVDAITNCRDTNRTQSFAYDALNRITSAATQGTSCTTCWGFRFGHMNGSTFVPGIDPWGNLFEITLTQGSGTTLSQTANIKNQFTGMTYDASGNLSNDGGGNSYTYDAENRITTTAGYTYVYDGDGQRVKKCSNAGCTSGTMYWTGANSNVLSESGVGGSILEEYIYFGGARVARREPAGTLHYYFADHLGSADVLAGNTGSIQKESDYSPYGGEVVITGSDTNRYKFTGKERDTESGLDDFGERYYSSTLGRFTSVDPQLTDLERQVDPQQLNMYGYGRNNPLRYTDDSGEEVKEAVQVVTYQVHGTTANEAFANAKATSGFKSETGEAMSGNTSASMQVVNKNVETSETLASPVIDSFATAEVKSADVKLDQTITLPSWAEQSKASPEEQKAFNDGVASLKEHEEGHATINREQAQKLDKSLPGTRGSGQGKTPEEARNKAMKNMVHKENSKARQNRDETRTRQQEYDKKTEHGGKQHEQ